MSGNQVIGVQIISLLNLYEILLFEELLTVFSLMIHAETQQWEYCGALPQTAHHTEAVQAGSTWHDVR